MFIKKKDVMVLERLVNCLIGTMDKRVDKIMGIDPMNRTLDERKIVFTFKKAIRMKQTLDEKLHIGMWSKPSRSKPYRESRAKSSRKSKVPSGFNGVLVNADSNI